MKALKKLTLFFLCAMLLLMPVYGCGGQEAGPLRVCLDLGLTNGADISKAERQFDALLKLVSEQDGPQDVEVEFVPAEGEDRKGALTRLHTEIMSGKGPDLFIVRAGFQEDLLFPYPEKSAKNGLFLNLDKLMAKSQFTEWDQQVQPILEAGKTEKGQFLIPLTYQFNMTCFLKEDVSHTPSGDISWEDMAASSDPVDQASISFWGGPEQKKQSIGCPTLHNSLGKLCDYDSEELLFTADELRGRIYKNLELMDAADTGALDQLPAYYQPLVGPDFDSHVASYFIQIETIDPSTPMTYVPMYTKDGGVAAAVRSYAAISAGSKHKEGAFFILDYLMSQESQQNSGFYNIYLAGQGTFEGFPMDARLMSPEYPVTRGEFGDTWCLTQENFDSLCAVRDAITAVNFFDTVTMGVYDLESDCLEVYCGYGEGDIDSLIDETCRVLAMSLKES